MKPAAMPSLEPDLRETDLVAAASRGDQDAFEQIYRRHVDRVHALCLRWCGDPDQAEQLVQAAFVQAWRHLPGFRGQSGLGTWLHRLAVNLVLDWQRARARRARRELTTDPLAELPSLAALDAGLDNRDGDRLDLERAIAMLPDSARTIFVLHEVEGYSVREVSRLLRIAEGTVKTQLFRARRRLREVLR
ncbi:MAG: RNA polymerase sigma factor [Candidatus Krumholzibacteria bacterium]|jgi:RNA polymerase sigma-70 factor (ECF subfamily)|nr:RNA polymerase sigma factor [Candidatus Krumholzibacteria bacterium]